MDKLDWSTIFRIIIQFSIQNYQSIKNATIFELIKSEF